jgi:hypothetical protein
VSFDRANFEFSTWKEMPRNHTLAESAKGSTTAEENVGSGGINSLPFRPGPNFFINRKPRAPTAAQDLHGQQQHQLSTSIDLSIYRSSRGFFVEQLISFDFGS